MRTLIVAFASLLAVAGVATAGTHGIGRVVFFGSGFFAGGVTDTRSSSDSVAYLSCDLFASPTGTSGFCSARDPSYRSAMCRFSAPAMVQAAQSINAASWVRVDYDGAGNCTQIHVEQGSENLP